MTPAKIARIAIPAALLALVVALVAMGNQSPGRVYREGNVVGKVISVAEETGTFSATLASAEGGGDFEHESDHVFEALAGLGGVAVAELDTATGSLTVRYDAEKLTEGDIAGALAASGYGAPPTGTP